MEYQKEFDCACKVVLLGDSNVGKTALLSRFVRDDFTLELKATIGVEFVTKMVEVKPLQEMSNKNGRTRTVKTQLFDSAGQERFRAISMAYYHGCTGAMICYDVTKRNSFENVEYWLRELRANSNPQVVMLVGTKCDLIHLRQVATEEGKQFAQKGNLLFMETSALKRDTVEIAFQELIQTIYFKLSQRVSAPVNEAGLINLCDQFKKQKRFRLYELHFAITTESDVGLENSPKQELAN